jgi:hypothetical protein
MASLNDPESAHALRQRNVTWGKFDLDWVLDHRDPDLLYIGFLAYSLKDATGVSFETLQADDAGSKTYFPRGNLRKLIENKRVRDNYAPVGLRTRGGYYLNIIAKRTAVSEIIAGAKAASPRPLRAYEDEIVLFPAEFEALKFDGKPEGTVEKNSEFVVRRASVPKPVSRIVVKANGWPTDISVTMRDRSSQQEYATTIRSGSAEWRESEAATELPAGEYDVHVKLLAPGTGIGQDAKCSMNWAYIRLKF